MSNRIIPLGLQGYQFFISFKMEHLPQDATNTFKQIVVEVGFTWILKKHNHRVVKFTTCLMATVNFEQGCKRGT